MAGPTRLFGPDSWKGADWGEESERSERREGPSRRKQRSSSAAFLIGADWGQQGPPADGHGTVRMVRMDQGGQGWGQQINWSGDGLAASAVTAVTARWTARQGEGTVLCLLLCKACPYIATGCAASARVCVCSDLKPGGLAGLSWVKRSPRLANRTRVSFVVPRRRMKCHFRRSANCFCFHSRPACPCRRLPLLARNRRPREGTAAI